MTHVSDIRNHLQEGQPVKVFHPKMMGVVKEGTIKRVGRSYLHVDFGSVLGGTLRVPYSHIVEVEHDSA